VRLSGVNDYINASHVTYRIPNARGTDDDFDLRFIAAQDPLPHTVVDFWRMTWEYRITLIIALQSTVLYWPQAVDACITVGNR
jgi:protein tyrosine phosphatase